MRQSIQIHRRHVGSASFGRTSIDHWFEDIVHAAICRRQERAVGRNPEPERAIGVTCKRRVSARTLALPLHSPPVGRNVAWMGHGVRGLHDE